MRASWTTDRTHVPWFDSQVLNQWTTREIPESFYFCQIMCKRGSDDVFICQACPLLFFKHMRCLNSVPSDWQFWRLAGCWCTPVSLLRLFWAFCRQPCYSLVCLVLKNCERSRHAPQRLTTLLSSVQSQEMKNLILRGRKGYGRETGPVCRGGFDLWLLQDFRRSLSAFEKLFSLLHQLPTLPRPQQMSYFATCHVYGLPWWLSW